MMSQYGRLTFPNGRTGAPVIEGDLAILKTATSAWGKDAPARDRAERDTLRFMAEQPAWRDHPEIKRRLAT